MCESVFKSRNGNYRPRIPASIRNKAVNEFIKRDKLVTEIVDDFGISREQLYRWKEE